MITILYIYDSQPGTQQNDIILSITEFELPTQSVMSKENGCHVNMLNMASSCTANSSWLANFSYNKKYGEQQLALTLVIYCPLCVWSYVQQMAIFYMLLL